MIPSHYTGLAGCRGVAAATVGRGELMAGPCKPALKASRQPANVVAISSDEVLRSCQSVSTSSLKCAVSRSWAPPDFSE